MSDRLPQEDGRGGRTVLSGTELGVRLGFLLLALLPLFLCRCSSVAVRKEGGASSRFWPTAARWQEASMNALRDPTTWGPAAGAAVVAAGGWDPKISHWATTRTPVFGSINRAKSASDDLRSLSDFAMLGTSMAVPGGDHPWRSRLERLIVEETGVFMASSVTNLMKRSLSRERPDLSDNRSFPSGHSTRAFAYNGMSSRNLDNIDMPDAARLSLKIAFTGMAAGTAWARVEGERHYPSDVLAGAAVGNFVALFIHDAFLGKEEKISFSLELDRREQGFSVGIVLP